jgi:hypothetical protein
MGLPTNPGILLAWLIIWKQIKATSTRDPLKSASTTVLCSQPILAVHCHPSAQLAPDFNTCTPPHGPTAPESCDPRPQPQRRCKERPLLAPSSLHCAAAHRSKEIQHGKVTKWRWQLARETTACAARALHLEQIDCILLSSDRLY